MSRILSFLEKTLLLKQMRQSRLHCIKNQF